MSKVLKHRVYTIPLGDVSVPVYPDDDGVYPEGDELIAEVHDRLMEGLMQSLLVLPEDLVEYEEE